MRGKRGTETGRAQQHQEMSVSICWKDRSQLRCRHWAPRGVGLIGDVVAEQARVAADQLDLVSQRARRPALTA